MLGSIVVVVVLALFPAALAAQSLPKDIRRSIDSFTGDTLYETKYGRLDAIQGCHRDGLSIVWRFQQGPTGRREAVIYDYLDLGDAFTGSAGRWVDAQEFALNLDGTFVTGRSSTYPPKQTRDGSKGRREVGGFWLPEGTLRQIATASVAKLKIFGTTQSCDGVIEPNMKTRIRALLDYLKGSD
jgi:hypothetical protein